MTYEEKVKACRYMLREEEYSLGWYVHIMGINDLFTTLAYAEYLKKKAEFLLSYSRDKLGRFKSNNK